jgi:hypothetical protein
MKRNQNNSDAFQNGNAQPVVQDLNEQDLEQVSGAHGDHDEHHHHHHHHHHHCHHEDHCEHHYCCECFTYYF